MKPGEPGYRGPETEDEFLAEVEALPAPLVLEWGPPKRRKKPIALSSFLPVIGRS